MRTIKFRCWNKEKEKMYDWETITEAKADGTIYWISLQDNKNILMQFTGLLDMNGKEIYEGDICTQTFGSEPQEKGAVTIGITTGVMVGNRPVWHHNVEIIGNIYEDSNLLHR